MMNTCPYATLMAGTLDSRLWTVNELIQSIRCYGCYHNIVNTWAPCIRRSSQINLHPNLTSRCRQMWYLTTQLLKYCNMETQFKCDETFTFKGETALRYHEYSPSSTDRRDLLSNVPRRYQIAKIVARGKNSFFHFYCENRRHYSWTAC